MLRITADVFSGRPNPVVEILDESEARATLRQLSGDRSVLADPAAAADGGLGLRGFQIEVLGDELASRFGVESTLYVPAGAQSRGVVSPEVAERLVGLMERGSAVQAATGEAPTTMDAGLRDFILSQLETDGVSSVAEGAEPSGPPAAGALATCMYEVGAFNPGFWNNDATVRGSNNCYNYASNWRTNTFAQPGRGCGTMYNQIICPEMTRAALCDGMHHRFDCFPDLEKPRYLVALVVAPGPAFVDFHWYRRQQEGFWGHKPGPSAARNTDESNMVIYNPEFANRGPYTQFCGYFYGCNSQRMRIR
jgi:hypothetical protein